MALCMSRPWKHPKTGIYWLRKVVPDDLRAAVGKREFKFSLKTKDAAEAKQRHAAELAKIEAQLANLRKPPQRISLTELQHASAFAYERCLAAKGHLDGCSWDTKLAETMWDEPTDRMVGGVNFDFSKPSPERPLFDWSNLETEMRARFQIEWCDENARRYLSETGLQVDHESHNALARAISFGVQKAMLALQRQARGDFGADVDAPTRPTADKPLHPDRVAASKPQITFKSLLDGWAAEKQPTEKTIYTWRRVVDQIAAFVKHKDAARLTSDDLLNWKNALVEAGLRTKTIRDSKIAPLRAILQWGVDNRKLPANPASRIVVAVRAKQTERRRGYTDDEAALILVQAAKEKDPVRRWLPLLCAYSGARLSEICQLRVEDVIQLDGHWCMKLDPSAGSLKTESSERAVPLHPAIIEAGFLQFVKTVRKGAIFADLRADRFGNRGGTGTKVIGRWVRGLGVVDARLSPAHSWRHRFKTLSRRFGLATDLANAITGHHRKTVADSYGEFPIEALFRELVKIPPVQ